MKKNKVKLWAGCGIFCIAAMVLSTWYAVTFNDSRLVVPMDFGSYSFIPQDLPMLLSVSLFGLYALALCFLLVRSIRKNKRDTTRTNRSRRVHPRLGFLGLLGFLGFAGFWAYPATGDVSPFLFFLFFGFFGFFYEGKMSGTLMDERFRENAARAQLITYRTTFSITLLALLILCQGKLLGSLEYTLIATIIVLSLTLALGIFLPEYLLYRYDHDDRIEEGEE
ncbi:MAG: DUF3796 domain-containing protein [Angelakisella sp.]|nr:DUF3796 domain-containing protein [Angelakisella sp.]